MHDAALRATFRIGALGPAIAALVLLCSAAGALAAVGATKPKGDVAKGKVLFKQKCGTCHRLAPAKSQGRVGPNLTGERIEYSLGVWVITNGLSLMPGFKGELKQVQIRDLAAYLAQATSA